jgi:hypothetical protein
MATKIASRGEQGSLVEDRRQHDEQDQTRVERHLWQARNKSQHNLTQNEHDGIGTRTWRAAQPSAGCFLPVAWSILAS